MLLPRPERPVRDFADGARVRALAWPDDDEAIRAGDGQRPDEHFVDDAEDRGICPDGKGEHDDGACGKSRALPEPSKRNSKILNDAGHRSGLIESMVYRPVRASDSLWYE